MIPDEYAGGNALLRNVVLIDYGAIVATSVADRTFSPVITIRSARSVYLRQRKVSATQQNLAAHL